MPDFGFRNFSGLGTLGFRVFQKLLLEFMVACEVHSDSSRSEGTAL